MNDYKQKLKLGIFVVSGLLLLILALFFLGLADLFVEKVEIATRFEESVQGLSVGSEVKYRGVQVGNVSQIAIQMETKTVWVTMQIEPRYFFSSKDRQQDFEELFREELKNGLSCRLEYAGITGMKFIDFDYFRSENQLTTPPKEYPGSNRAIYAVSVPSTFEDISSTVFQAMERLAEIPLEEISTELVGSLQQLSGLLADPMIKTTIARIGEVAENIEHSTGAIDQTLQAGHLNRLFNEASQSLEAFEKLISTVEQQVLAMQLPQSSAAVRSAAGSVTEVQPDLEETIRQLNRTLDSIRQLSDYLNQDPEALLKGKAAPEQNY